MNPARTECESLPALEHADPAGVPEFRPTWRTGPVVALAAGPSAAEVLPILADALEEAGCDDERILTHCRGGGPHLPACWVLELIRRSDPSQFPPVHTQQTLQEAFRIIWSESHRARGTWREWFAYTSPAVAGVALVLILKAWFRPLDEDTAWWVVFVAVLLVGAFLTLWYQLRKPGPPRHG
jgi:hypothetical protein